MEVEIAFETPKLRDLCEDPRAAIDAWGGDVAEQLLARLLDFRAAKQFGDLFTISPWVNIPTTDRLEVDLGRDHTAIFEPNNNPARLTDDGQVDWTHTSRVKLLRVVSGAP